MNDPEIATISQSNFQFSSALLQELPQNGNPVFSPFSLGLVLLMARFGARGQTAVQIEKALQLPQTTHLDDLVPVRRGFFKTLKKIDRLPVEDCIVTVANRMFIEDGFKINKDFKSISKSVLNVTVTPLNFTDGLNASETINSWVKNRTNGKFDQLFEPNSFNNETKLVLVNAIYFKSPWKYPFEVENTKLVPFFGDNSRILRVPFMTSEDEFPYGDLPDVNAKIVSIPYKSDRFSMQIIMPTQPQTVEELVGKLKDINVDTIRKNLKTPGLCEKVKLHLPRFKIKSSLGLVHPLQQIGATDMFRESTADFTGIPRNVTDAPNLFVSEVIQQAFISVDEEGTEAAAASGIRAGVTCSPSATDIKVNRAFYYQIVEKDTNTVLFAGIVRDPSA